MPRMTNTTARALGPSITSWRASDWRVPIGLIALSAVPAIAGILRLSQLAGGEATAESARFFADPLPGVVHIVSAGVFCVVGAFQFSPGLRRRYRGAHSAAGRVLAPLGIVAALSGLWLSWVYPPVVFDGSILFGLRQLAGVAMAAFLALALLAVRRRDFAAHGAWMTRGYALGLGAGTQALTHVPLLLLEGLQNEHGRALAMGAGWAINAAVAEWIIGRRRATRSRVEAGATMRAVVYERYGGPEVLAEARVPVPEPKPHQVRVRVEHASVNAADYRLMRADPFLARLGNGLFRPKKKILGADVAGVVEAVGAEVTTLAIGDPVFGVTFQDDLGAFAERVCVSERALARRPAELGSREAAAVPLAAITALQAVRDRAKIGEGDRVLIQGAGGGVGTCLVQLAKERGAHVTAVCGPSSAALVRSLGADRVLDYTSETFTDRPERYDAIFGVNGHRPLGDYVAHLSPGGTYVMVGGTNRQIFDALLFGRARFLFADARIEALTLDAARYPEDLAELRAMLAAGALRPIVDRVFSLGETADALRYAEAGHVRGKIVIDVRDRSA